MLNGIAVMRAGGFYLARSYTKDCVIYKSKFWTTDIQKARNFRRERENAILLSKMLNAKACYIQGGKLHHEIW